LTVHTPVGRAYWASRVPIFSPNKEERLLALPLLRTGLATLPNKKERLLALPLLRTGLATFITSGSRVS
jgi:hypothetical protein